MAFFLDSHSCLPPSSPDPSRTDICPSGCDFLGMSGTYLLNSSSRLCFQKGMDFMVLWVVFAAHFSHSFLILNMAFGTAIHSHLLQGTLSFKKTIKSKIDFAGSPQPYSSPGLFVTLAFSLLGGCQRGRCRCECIIFKKFKQDSHAM